MLTVEYDEGREELAICFDPEGLSLLIRELKRLAGDDHTHLMTREWGGTELDETTLGKHTKIVHHLRLVRRESRW